MVLNFAPDLLTFTPKLKNSKVSITINLTELRKIVSRRESWPGTTVEENRI